jgi:hypothetical protein
MPKFYDIRFNAEHLEKLVALMETQPFSEWKPIWISIQHQVALAKKAEADADKAAEKPNLSVVEGDAPGKVEAAE